MKISHSFIQVPLSKKKKKKPNPYLLTNIIQNCGQTTSSPDLKIRCTSDANTMNTFPLKRDKKSEILVEPGVSVVKLGKNEPRLTRSGYMCVVTSVLCILDLLT